LFCGFGVGVGDEGEEGFAVAIFLEDEEEAIAEVLRDVGTDGFVCVVGAGAQLSFADEGLGAVFDVL
jgi:hypothetical protein